METNTWNKGLKVFGNWEQFIDNDFKSEKELTDYINKYAVFFARDMLEVDYKNHISEFNLGVNQTFASKRIPRVDFLFTSMKDENILVECKNPKNIYSEVREGISQLLSYYCICKTNNFKIDRMIYVITKFDLVLKDIIKEFNLPIEIIVFSKRKALKLLSNVN